MRNLFTSHSGYGEVLDLDNADVFIITDLHLWYKPLRSMPNMLSDNERYQLKIKEMIKDSINPVVIFLGDIYHRGCKGSEEVFPLLEFPLSLNTMTDGKVYSVVGNHEMTYYKGNPFWALANVHSVYVRKKTFNADVLKVVDYLRIGSSLFYLKHYGFDYLEDDAEEVLLGVEDSFCLTHNTVMSTVIKDVLQKKGLDANVYDKKAKQLLSGVAIPRTNTLREVFVGHMHCAIAKFCIEEVVNDIEYSFGINYLGSIGRTSAVEYNKNTLREVPKISIRNGKYKSLEFLPLELTERHVAIKESQIKELKKGYALTKQREELKSMKALNGDSVVETLDSLVLDALSPECAAVYKSLREHSIPNSFVKALQNRDYSKD